MSVHIKIKKLHVANFRCYDEQTWQLKHQFHLFMGENGSGKTSILEAIYLMAYGRSFRQAKDAAWQRWGASSFRVHGEWQRYGPLHLDIEGKNKKLKILLQGRTLSQRKELKETFPVLVNSPQGYRLIDGDHNERRKWLDQTVMLYEHSSKIHYQSYLRAWMQRSRLIRRNGLTDELRVWEEQMVIHGRKVQTYRQKICDSLNATLLESAHWTQHPVQCVIQSHIPNEDEVWLNALSEHRASDKKTGRCFYGSHTDRLNIHFGEREVRSVASRGQQKLSSIAIKLAECYLRYDYFHVWPLLLLDDCFEALDEKHTMRVLKRLTEYHGQILMTAPQKISIPDGVDLQLWFINDGNKKKEF